MLILCGGDGKLHFGMGWGMLEWGKSRSPRAACLACMGDTGKLWCLRTAEEKNRVHLDGRRRPVRLPYSESRVVDADAGSRLGTISHVIGNVKTSFYATFPFLTLSSLDCLRVTVCFLFLLLTELSC